MDRDRNNISRRSLLTGAASGAALIGTGSVASAAVPPALVVPSAGALPQGTPSGLASISSPPERGVSYRFASWADLTPLNSLANGRVFQTEGVSVTTRDFLGCFFELPPGARVRDAEVYYSATTNTHLAVAVWSSGIATVDHVIASKQLGPFAGSSMHATRLVVPESANGPFPHGCMLAVYVDTLANQSIQVNGFRVGLLNAPLSPVLLTKPTTVYHSKSPIAANATKVISLAAHLPKGANGAIYTVAVNATTKAGVLHAGAAGAPLAVVAAEWGPHGGRTANTVTTAVSSARAIAVRSAAHSGRANVTVQLVGYLV